MCSDRSDRTRDRIRDSGSQRGSRVSRDSSCSARCRNQMSEVRDQRSEVALAGHLPQHYGWPDASERTTHRHHWLDQCARGSDKNKEPQSQHADDLSANASFLRQCILKCLRVGLEGVGIVRIERRAALGTPMFGQTLQRVETVLTCLLYT